MYWNSPGPVNTEKTVELALAKSREYGIDTIVVASGSGKTAGLLAGKAKNIVCVTHAAGYETPGASDMPEKNRQSLISQGVKVLTATHVLSGAERGLSRKFGGVYPIEIMAHSLRMFGQGVKVCVEAAVMALDAGLVAYGEDIIVVAGTSEGADTAIIVRPAHAANILDTYIAEIICKPRRR